MRNPAWVRAVYAACATSDLFAGVRLDPRTNGYLIGVHGGEGNPALMREVHDLLPDHVTPPDHVGVVTWPQLIGSDQPPFRDGTPVSLDGE